MRHGVKMRRWAAAVAGVLLLVAQGGCGRKYTVVGRIVVSPGESTSRIVELTPGPTPELGVPISGARVEMFLELDKTGRPVPGSTWTTSDSSAADGAFRLFAYASPGRRHVVGLEVSASGYETAYRTYVDYMDPDTQYFLITLVPSKERSVPGS